MLPRSPAKVGQHYLWGGRGPDLPAACARHHRGDRGRQRGRHQGPGRQRQKR